MIKVQYSSKFDELLTSLGARIVDGQFGLTSLSNDVRELLEADGLSVAGCKYRCWNIWYPNIYWVTRDPRCTVSFNTLAKRAHGLVELDDVVVGRAKPCSQTRRKGRGIYRLFYAGVQYPSEAALAREFGIEPRQFRSYRQLGWTREEIIENDRKGN